MPPYTELSLRYAPTDADVESSIFPLLNPAIAPNVPLPTNDELLSEALSVFAALPFMIESVIVPLFVPAMPPA